MVELMAALKDAGTERQKAVRLAVRTGERTADVKVLQ